MNLTETRAAAGIMIAHGNGCIIQVRDRSGGPWETIDNPGWNWVSNEYRIKPSPRLRPWREHEVPIGAWIRWVNKTYSKSEITDITDGYIHDSTNRSRSRYCWEYTPQTALNEMEWSRCGEVWSKCGVLEEQE